MRRIAVIGTTAWGTTLGVLLASKGMRVNLWARTESEATRLNADRQNVARLPNVVFPSGMVATSSLPAALDEADMVIMAVPSQTMRRNAGMVRPYLHASTLILSVSKGIETETTSRMSQVIVDEIGKDSSDRLAILSGPNFSKEVAEGVPTATVVAAIGPQISQAIQTAMSTSQFRVYVNNDVAGVELGGALKNIIALATGMSDGLGYGDNTRAALITRGLAEICRLGVATGAQPLTFSGLSGLGDLVATCTSRLSRNRFVGQELAGGRPLAEILSSTGGVAEGVRTTAAARGMAQRLHIDMPIVEQVYRVLYEGVQAKQAVPALMERDLKPELSAGICAP